MIIYGHKTREKQVATGQFHCPKCDTTQSFIHKKIGRWFSLFFIPLFQYKELGEYVECQSCLRAFKPEVLSLLKSPQNEANPDWLIGLPSEQITSTEPSTKNGRIWMILGGVIMFIGIVLGLILLLGASGSDSTMETGSVVTSMLFCPVPVALIGGFLLFIGWRKSNK